MNRLAIKGISHLKLPSSGMAKLAVLAIFLYPSIFVLPLQAAGQTTGAAFLEIPVGARPAAMGSAYSALAKDAYAPIWNAGGLGYLESTQLSAQHLAYLDSMRYEYFSAVHPLHEGQAIGFAMQYLGTGDIPQTDNDGNPNGDFSSYYSAYSFAYGRKISSNLALGGTAKWIRAKISDVSANAFGADFGLMSQWTDRLRVAATLTNLGSSLKFLNEGDPLPLAGRIGAAYQPSQAWTFSSDAVYRRTGVAGLAGGAHWKPATMIGLSLGYKTENLKGLSPLAGLTTGMSLEAWGSELAYAWVPFGDLGNTHYFSLLMRFGEAERARRNLVRLPNDRRQWQAAKVIDRENQEIERQQLIQLFDEKPDAKMAAHPTQELKVPHEAQ